jgi:antitoxin HicB
MLCGAGRACNASLAGRIVGQAAQHFHRRRDGSKAMNAKLQYPVVIEPLSAEDGGGFVATVPDLPGCMSDGETPEEALANVRDAVAAWIDEAWVCAPLDPTYERPFASARRVCRIGSV